MQLEVQEAFSSPHQCCWTTRRQRIRPHGRFSDQEIVDLLLGILSEKFREYFQLEILRRDREIFCFLFGLIYINLQGKISIVSELPLCIYVPYFFIFYFLKSYHFTHSKHARHWHQLTSWKNQLSCGRAVCKVSSKERNILQGVWKH